jgi:hypothetical protein
LSKKNKPNKRRLNIQNSSLQALSLEEKKRIRRELFFFSITTLILMLTIYVNNPKMPPLLSMLWGATVTTLLAFRAGGNQIILKSISNQKGFIDLPIFRRLQKTIRLISIAIIAIIVFPAIYYSPLREQLSIFLASVLAFSKTVADSIISVLSVILATISGYIGNILLGALGNLFYDIAKSLYKSLRPQRNK